MIADIDTLEPEQLRQALRAAHDVIERQQREVSFKQSTIDKLTHEMAVLKRLKFAAKSEAYTAEQKSLIEETLDADLAALAVEIEAHQPAKPEDKQQPKRERLPAHLPRREIRHEPEDTTCGCGRAMKRIGEDVAEKLDYPKASDTSSPPCLLRLLPAGAVAGRGLHPLESAAFARRTPISGIRSH